MAEAFFNKLTNSRRATSAACVDFIKKYKGKSTPEIVETMAEVGIDIGKQRMKLITKKMVNDADKVIVLCDKKYCPEYLLSVGDKLMIKTLNDPHQCDLKTVANIRDQIKKIVKESISI